MIFISESKAAQKRLKRSAHERWREGGIISVVDGDRLTRALIGGRSGCDLLFVQLTDAHGQVWVMGRVREHVDGEYFESKDEKFVVQVGIAPKEAAMGAADHTVAGLKLAAQKLYAIADVEEVDATGLVGSDGLLELIKRVEAAGMGVRIQVGDKPGTHGQNVAGQ